MDRRFSLVRRAWRELAGAALDLILPPACPACGEPASGLCAPCRRNLIVRSHGGCRRCGEATTATGQCRADHRPLQNLSRLHAPFRFVGTGGELVRRFKLDANAAAGRLLASAMAAAYARAGEGGRRTVLVPVPLHRARLRRRGFDQAAWLARTIGGRLGLRVEPGLLVRRRATLPQGDARVMSRAANVRGAFHLTDGDFDGRAVVLVDDVFTTGATARSCAELLRGAGVRDVSILVACRS